MGSPVGDQLLDRLDKVVVGRDERLGLSASRSAAGRRRSRFVGLGLGIAVVVGWKRL